MAELIQVIPAEQYFSITWKLTNRCNYDCMYCPSKWHDAVSQHHSLDRLKSAWETIHNKTKANKYKISFTGGEVTSSRSFLPFLRWLRENYSEQLHQILVTTNGSATLKYYTRLLEFVDVISLSLHSEHVNEVEFFNTVAGLKKQLTSSKFLQVNIMDEFWNADRIVQYQQLLDKLDVSYSVNQIDYSLQTRTYPVINGKLNFDFSESTIL
jgi:MoaA/NifB/PqqE/SkfB family radical SAM enzyme